jgi:hypothetical protein
VGWAIRRPAGAIDFDSSFLLFRPPREYDGRDHLSYLALADELHKQLTADRSGERAIVAFLRGGELRRHAIIPLEMSGGSSVVGIPLR